MSSTHTQARISTAMVGAFKKMAPRVQLRNPVMFVVYIAACITSVQWIIGLINDTDNAAEPQWFVLSVSVWLWFTVFFANFAEAFAEGRGKAQAASLKMLSREIRTKLLKSAKDHTDYSVINASDLRRDNLVLVESGEFIPCDGQVVKGIASVDESAITGESAPVIRESGGDSDAVTGGTRVLSDWLVIRISCNPGETFLDQMVGLVEGAKRQKTPNEVALSIFLSALTLIFLITHATLLPFSLFSVEQAGQGSVIGVSVLVALMVCLSPTTIGGLLSAIGIAGMNRLLRANVIAMSGRAVEAAGDVDVMLLDKTGTITHGNRQAHDFIPARGITQHELLEAVLLSSLSDMTPEGKSIVMLATRKAGANRVRALPEDAELIEFSAETRVSGVKFPGRIILKGAPDAIGEHLKPYNTTIPDDVLKAVDSIARTGGTPLVVVDTTRVLGAVHLKDVVKSGIRERLADLRKMGIKSIMITGDSPITAAAIAAEAGVDDYQAEATPEHKLKMIRAMQADGALVAMVGDGTNDAPALAQSDVAVCMNSGTQAAKEAANMIDLDSDPTKLIEIVEIGKQLLITRGALTTFSISNDIAKYFAIIPAAFVSTYPSLAALNIMGLASPLSAILAALIFNALLIIGLIPLALKGVQYRPMPAAALLRRNLSIYGVGGLVLPFIGIKLINELLVALGLF